MIDINRKIKRPEMAWVSKFRRSLFPENHPRMYEGIQNTIRWNMINTRTNFAIDERGIHFNIVDEVFF